MEVGQVEDLDSMQIVVSSGDPNFDWIRPIRERQLIRCQAPQLNGISTVANMTANEDAPRGRPPAAPEDLSNLPSVVPTLAGSNPLPPRAPTETIEDHDPPR
jgi:hypothetical protein